MIDGKEMNQYEECAKCNHRRYVGLFETGSVVCTPCKEYKKPTKEEAEQCL